MAHTPTGLSRPVGARDGGRSDTQPVGLSRIHMYSLLNDILLIHYLCSEASARQVVGPRPEFALEGTLACSRYGVFERAIADGPTA